MDPITVIAGVLKAWIEFLSTPEGQELCKANRQAIAKLTARIDAIMDHGAPAVGLTK